MSASEWARIVDERDEAVAHLENLMQMVDKSSLPNFEYSQYQDARRWLKESIYEETF